jgi:5-deoxy-D-glucuronate isomerase
MEGRLQHLLRLPSGAPWSIELTRKSPAFDALLLQYVPPEPPSDTGAEGPPARTEHPDATPWIQRSGIVPHAVGRGAHARRVCDAATPPGFLLHVGETRQRPGRWSSWPAHAQRRDMARAREHEEVFFCVTPGVAVIHLNGRWSTGERVDEARLVRNGDALAVPLGSHPIVAAPDAPLVYVWAYAGGVLSKQYNRWSTDVATYVS